MSHYEEAMKRLDEGLAEGLAKLEAQYRESLARTEERRKVLRERLLEAENIRRGPKRQQLRAATLSAIVVGIAWVDTDENTLVGRAADGAEVTLGSLDMPETLESYLRANPTPSTW